MKIYIYNQFQIYKKSSQSSHGITGNIIKKKKHIQVEDIIKLITHHIY